MNVTVYRPAFRQLDMKNCVFTIVDGGSQSITVTVGEGNFQWTERVTREYTLDRGVLDEVRNGDEAPVDVNFAFTWEQISSDSADTATLEDVLKNQNAAADWVSSDADACRPYAVDLIITNTPDCVTGDIEVLTFSDFRYEELSHDLRAGTIACTGKCNITMPSSERITNS